MAKFDVRKYIEEKEKAQSSETKATEKASKATSAKFDVREYIKSKSSTPSSEGVAVAAPYIKPNETQRNTSKLAQIDLEYAKSNPKLPTREQNTGFDFRSNAAKVGVPSQMTDEQLERIISEPYLAQSEANKEIARNYRATGLEPRYTAEETEQMRKEAEAKDRETAESLDYLKDVYSERHKNRVGAMTDEELEAEIEANGATNPFEYAFSSTGEKFISDTKSMTPKAEKYAREVIGAYESLPDNLRSSIADIAPYYKPLTKQVVVSAMGNSVPAWQKKADTAYNSIKDELYALGYNDEDIHELLVYSKSLFDAETSDKLTENLKNAGTGELVAANIASVPANMASGIGQLDLTLQTLRNRYTGNYRPVNYNSPSAVLGQFSRKTRAETSERIDNPVVDFIYNTGMSIVDSAASAAVGGQYFAPIILSGSAGLNAIYDAKERGLSDIQAVNLGLAASLNEALFEKISIDKFFEGLNNKEAKKFIVQIFTQAVPEGLEEVGTSLANQWADTIIAADKSQFSADVSKYMQDGKTEEEAKALAARDFFMSLGLDFLGGFLSGGVFGTVQAVANKVSSKGNTQAETPKIEATVNEEQVSDTSTTPKKKTAPTTVKEAETATGFGKYGAELVADIANSTGATLDEVSNAVKTAYMAGRTDLDISKATLETETQIKAFTAGKQDALMQNIAAKEEAKNATVNEEFTKYDTPNVTGETLDNSAIVLEKNESSYPYDEREVIDGYENAVDDGVIGFINKIRSMKNPVAISKQKHTIGEVSERFKNDVRRLTNTEFDGDKYILRGNSVNHVDNRHGKNGVADHSMANDNDFARIGWVLDNYDTIEIAIDKKGNPEFDYQNQNSDQTPSPVIKIGKKINGTYFVVEAVPVSSAKAAFVKSAYISKNGISTPTAELLTVSDQDLQHLPDTENLSRANHRVPGQFTDTINSISQSEEKINSKDSNATAEKDSTSPLQNDREGGTMNTEAVASEGATETTGNAKTQTLKHTKNIYSLFKGATRVVVGKDAIISSDVAVPFSDNALDEIKNIVDKNNIEMGGSVSFAKIGVYGNDIVLSGNPKVSEMISKGRRASVYVFKVGDEYYICEQKYLDAFNNGENTIKANKNKYVSWSVHDKNGNIVGAFLPVANAKITDAEYNNLQSVSEVLEANKAKKAAQKKAPFNAAETKLLRSQPKLMTIEANGDSFITDGVLIIKADSSAIDYIKEEYKTNPYRDVVPTGANGERAFTGYINNDVVGEVSQTVSDDITETDKNGRTRVKQRRTACIVGDMAFLFDSKRYDMLNKRSATMKILSGGNVKNTIVAGYDSNGDLVGFVMPIRPADGSYVEVDGKQIPYTFDTKKGSSPKSATKEKATAKETPKNKKANNTDMFQDGGNDNKLAMWTTKRVSGEVKPKSISEIVASIEHEFGINITTGHIRGKGVLGTYTKENRGIKTKIANNLPVISHELGHYFERTLDIKSQLTDELISELESQIDAEFAKNYTDEQIIREGVAEYVRRFLQNRETAAIDYPKFNDFFLKLLPSRDLAKLEQLADDINAYYSLDADTATSAIRFREEGGVDLRTPIEKLKDTGNSLYQAWIDSNYAIKRFDKATGSNAYMYASNAAYSDAIAGQIITGDLTDKNGQYISSGLKTALHGINLNNKDEYRLFGEYLTVKHGPERLREGMRVFADDRKNSTAFMERRQAELEEQYPQFEEASTRLYAFIKQFYKAWGVETGLISESTLKNWSERWEYYVPFNRVMEKGKGFIGAKRGFANQNSTIKKARGSGRDIQHPVDNIIDNVVKMVNAGTRNNVMSVITDYAEKLGADATLLEKVPMPMTATKMDMTGVKDNLTTWIEESELDADSKEKASGIVNNLDDILIQYGRGKAFGNVVTVMKNGEPQAWKINDVGLLESLTSLTPKTMDGILDAYAVVSRFMTSNITGNNLVWSIFSNLPRDFATFFTYSKNKNIVEMAKGVGGAYLNKFKGDSASPLYKEFLAMGGGKTSAYTSDRNLAKNARKNLSSKIDANPISLIGFVSDLVESGPRFATYKMMREAGMSPQEAFYEAMDVTTNFRRSGRISKELNKVVPFFNANVQGLDKLRRWITLEELAGKPERKKAITKRTISYIAVSAALGAISYAINNGDEEKEEEYEQLSTYTKNSYFVFPIGDGKYFAIPKPRDIGVLSSFFETCLEYGVGENDHAFDEFYAYASENFLPAIANDIAQVGSNGLVETGMGIIGSFGMIGVVGYLGANRDFLGRPIVSSGLQSLEPKDQYTDRTSKMAYWLGQAFNGSPEQIDYFFQQILGGWWKGQKALFPVGEKNLDWSLGVKNTYVKDNQYSTDLTNWLYDRADTTARAKNSNPTDIEKAITAKWDSNMTDFYGKYYKKAKNNSSSTAARATRQIVLDMIREYQKGIDGDYKTSLQKAVEAVCKSKNSTEYLPSVMPAEVTDGANEKHTLSDSQYVEYQTDYLRLYWETVEDTMTNNMSETKKAQILLAAKKVAREQATERTLKRIGAPSSEFATKYKGVDNDDLTRYFAAISEANADDSTKKKEVVDVIDGLGVDNDDAWTLYLSRYDSTGAQYAKRGGIEGNVYIDFIDALDRVDKPTEAGIYGTYTQEEATAAISMLKGLSREDKAILWHSVNPKWKNNPFR